MSSTSSMTMAMSSTPTSNAVTNTSTAASDMGMSMGNECKISMLWNWYTVDACFLSTTWHITSHGMFAGSCIGVILLVVVLEFLRRVQREYDHRIRRQDQNATAARPVRNLDSENTSLHAGNGNKYVQVNTREGSPNSSTESRRTARAPMVRRQLVRATMHMLQFGVAYFVMLLAMYYNGYFIICILIGAFLGSFIFSWDQVGAVAGDQTGDVTGCCG